MKGCLQTNQVWCCECLQNARVLTRYGVVQEEASNSTHKHIGRQQHLENVVHHHAACKSPMHNHAYVW